MAKVLPAGANVNLGLGEDPMDRLLKTIQVASQAQGVINQATLQRDRRQAIQLESAQTLMANTLSNVEKSDYGSLNSAEQNLNNIRDNFKKKYPEMSDRIESFHGTSLNEIKTFKRTHEKFNRIKDSYNRQLEKFSGKILDLDNEFIYETGSDMFKEDYSDLISTISTFNANASDFRNVLGSDFDDLFLEMSSSSEVLGQMPQLLPGEFNDAEQSFVVEALTGAIDGATFKTSMLGVKAKTEDVIVNKNIPVVEKKLETLTTAYEDNLTAIEKIKNGDYNSLTLQGNESAEDIPGLYFDDATGVFMFNEAELTPAKLDYSGLTDEEKEKYKQQISEQSVNILKGINKNSEFEISETDKELGEFQNRALGYKVSHKASLPGNKWWWENKESEEIEDIFGPDGLDENSTVNVNNIKKENGEYVNIPKTNTQNEVLSTAGDSTKVRKMSIRLNDLQEKIETYEFSDKIGSSFTERGTNRKALQEINFVLGKGRVSTPIKIDDVKEAKVLHDEVQKAQEEYNQAKEAITRGVASRELNLFLFGQMGRTKDPRLESAKKQLKTAKQNYKNKYGTSGVNAFNKMFSNYENLYKSWENTRVELNNMKTK